MQFPLNLIDLCGLLAFISGILFVTSEVVLPYWEKNLLPINKKRLKNLAITTGIAFLMLAMANIMQRILFLS
jgi:hypothetical protein